MTREHLLAVDGNNLLMRAVKALDATGSVMMAAGENTGPLVVFIQMLSKYVRQLQPDRVVVCFDGGRSTRRVALYPEYKANRAQGPKWEGETDHFALAAEWLSLSGVFHVERKGYEADDLIGAYWRICAPMDMTILTGDKDLLQLASDTVRVLTPAANKYADDKLWTPELVQEEYGCQPHHLPLVKAMMGDKTDNIEGMRGIGPFRAVALGERNGWDLERLCADPRLEGHSDVVRRNLSLVDLRAIIGVDLPVPPPFAPTEPGTAAWEMLIRFYERYEMHSMKARAPIMWKEPNG